MYLPRQLADPLERIETAVRADDRFVGLAVGGSVLAGTADAHSDLDLVLAVEEEAYEAVMRDRLRLAAAWGDLLAAFTGEHVGEPRLIVALYAPLVHVDLKFARLSELGGRIEDPAIVWERDGRMSAALSSTVASPLTVDPQWIEDRFWVWIHYATTKLERGELYEVIDVLAFLRSSVLVPLECARRGWEPRGVRKVESFAPVLADQLTSTVASYDRRSCGAALEHCVDLYLQLRSRLPQPPRCRERVTAASRAHLRSVVAELGDARSRR